MTDGGYNAEVIKLLLLGRKLVAPEKEGEDLAGRRDAILRPRIMRGFFERYRRAKFPNNIIAVNGLKGLSIPSDRAETALKIVKENGRYAGIIRDTPTGPFVSLDTPGVPAPMATPATVEEEEWTETPTPSEKQQQLLLPTSPPATTPISTQSAYDPAKANRVIISHGKKREMLPKSRSFCSAVRVLFMSAGRVSISIRKATSTQS